MAAFEAQELRRFRSDVMQRLRSVFPEQYRDATDDELARFVDWGIERARSYEIVLEPDVARFIELISGFGEKFETEPQTAWMADILGQTKASPAWRLNAITERLAFSEA